jgi:hypothetical protein
MQPQTTVEVVTFVPPVDMPNVLAELVNITGWCVAGLMAAGVLTVTLMVLRGLLRLARVRLPALAGLRGRLQAIVKAAVGGGSG